MKTIKNKLKQHQERGTGGNLFRNEEGVIDLASIMVGVIVIGLIGGVIASTIFVVIPWAQDNAAKQQLDSIASAESAYMGMSSANPSPLLAGYAPNSFGNSAQLKAANLLQTGTTYCAVTPADGNSYSGYSQSSSGNVWFMTDKNTQPAILTDPVPAECGFLNANAGSSTPAPYVDPTPTLTSLTLKCDVITTGILPWQTNLIGKETWDDGTTTTNYTYVGQANNISKTLTAGKTYKVTFDGTYQNFTTVNSNLKSCLISMDYWGDNTGVSNASNAFDHATKLVAVPAHIPSTITNMSNMFYGDSSFNQNINTWNVSNVVNMSAVFYDASSFNQPLNNWDVSKVTDMNNMFRASAFNQPLDNWNTANVTNMTFMFYNAPNFNQPIGGWNTEKVSSMNNMFGFASVFNQPIGAWNTANVTDMSNMFQYTVFNQPIKIWNVSKVTASVNFRYKSSLTTANSPF